MKLCGVLLVPATHLLSPFPQFALVLDFKLDGKYTSKTMSAQNKNNRFLVWSKQSDRVGWKHCIEQDYLPSFLLGN